MDEANVYVAESNTTDSIDSNSEDKKELELPIRESLDTRICLVGKTRTDANVISAAQKFGVPVVSSETGAEFLNDGSWDTVYVVGDFSGPVYEAIHRSEQRVLGPTALQQCSERGEGLPNNARPLYTMAMCGLIVCFTGFRKKDELTRLISLIHNMGGSIRKDMVSKVTHLIANQSGGDKYQYAVTFRVPIMAESWVHTCWELRNDPAVNALTDDMMACHKLLPLQGARVCFHGFPDDERDHMAEVLVENGGISVDLEDFTCTHVVVDESIVQNIPEKAPLKAAIVKVEWFWASIQNEVCSDEKDYLFEDYLESLLSPGRNSAHGTPGSSTRPRKRKRLRDTMSRLLQTESPAVQKRRSSVSDAGFLSVSGSFLDTTPGSPDTLVLEEEDPVAADTPRKNLTARQQVFIELLQTEINYVNILDTIMKLFKAPLEDMLDTESPLLSKIELNTIFGHLGPIHDIHKKMLEDLKWTSAHWKEDICIGDIVLKFAPDLVKAYPQFVNFFEGTKNMIVQCDQTRPRFHAFLKICQTRPECGRQSLQELLIRPVQRLPSISLLLNDILKHTDKKNPDHSALERALSAIREVMTYINEDKRKTENQFVMFGIFNDIDCCPPNLVSAQRNFVSRVDVMELSEGLSGRGDTLVLFLFSDTLEVCKRRNNKGHNSMKSPNTSSLTRQASGKPYKHIRLMPLTNIKKVIDIKETNDCHNVFALMCRSPEEFKERLFSFTIMDDETDKGIFLKTLCRQMANAICRPDADNFLASLESDQLDIDTSDVVVGTLSKAFKFARTRLKVGRAFSFNKTPSKLKRAVSTMISPFGSTNNLTPSYQLAQMRLASCNNLNELTGSSNKEETYVAPMSVQPTRKNKNGSVTMASLRRL